jgi:PAS domain S-box-containing protein
MQPADPFASEARPGPEGAVEASRGRHPAGGLESQLQFETLISDTSAALLAARPEGIERAIERALDRVREFFQADRCGLLSVAADPQRVNVRLASYAEGVSHVPPDVNMATLFPWGYTKLLVERAPIRVSRTADLPPEAEAERPVWEQMGIRSALTLPIETGGDVRHLIVIQTVHRERDWPDEFLTRLRVLGELLVGALERKEMVARLCEAEARVRVAADAAEAGLWVLDSGTGVFWASERARTIFGIARDEVISMERFEASVNPADRDLVRRAIDRALRGREPVRVEYRIRRGDGQERWIDSRGRTQLGPDGAPDRLTGVSIDITETRLAEEGFRRSEERLASGAELAGLGYYELDFGTGASFNDERVLDERARGPAAVLDGAPWLVVEGVLIAASLRDSRKVELRLPATLAGREAALLNTADAIRSLARLPAPRIQVDVQRDSRPGCWGEGAATDRSRLVHTPETWCRIARLFAGEPALDDALLTLRRGMKQRGLVELSRSGTLRRQIDGWVGGVEVEGQDAVLVFDDGLGGFLPLSGAELSCQPPSLASAGIIPAPSSLMVMAAGVCILKQTRRAVYRHWQLAEGEEAPVRGLLARAARLVTEITLGRGEPAHLVALDELALEFAAQGLGAAWPLGSSLRHFREQWERHVRRESCPEGLCLERQAAPCQRTCPANIDIPTFVAHLGQGDYRSTIEVIRRDNPLPLTCGLVCPAPCESACVRGGSNGAVFIRPLKAKAAEHCLADGGYPRPEIAPATGKRIGIVGSGPSGLTAAYYLRLLGHDVEIHEAQEHAGGMLRYGIPAYRNPPDLLEKEIDQIRTLGVRIFTSAPVASVAEFRKGYDAVFLGLGTQKARLLPVQGAHLPFVLGGIDFLRAARSGQPVRVGPRVVVIGGGNVSIDVALTALRQGATHVDLTSLEKRRDMPASPGEIELAVAEGVQLRPGWGPLRFEEEGVAVFQFCERVKDETGKFDPKFESTRLLELDADHVILATGQGTDLACLEGSGVESDRGYVVADPRTKMTTVPGIFAGGDGQHGPRTAVEAIRAGKIAAAGIDAWLRGVAMDAATGIPVRRAEVAPLTVLAGDRPHLRRAAMPERSVEEVLGEGNYVRIEEGLTDAMANDEARRCLRCDLCIGCGLCMAACSEMGVEALRMEDTPAGRLAYLDFLRPAERCIGCGACSQVCPTGAIRVEDRDGLRRTIITGTVVREQALLACSDCGAATQTPAHWEFLRRRQPEEMAAHLGRELCPSCARRRADRPTVPLPGRARAGPFESTGFHPRGAGR